MLVVCEVLSSWVLQSSCRPGLNFFQQMAMANAMSDGMQQGDANIGISASRDGGGMRRCSGMAWSQLLLIGPP